MAKNKLTRGIRNNNPFNIKRSQVAWYGEVPAINGRSDKLFEQFYSMEFGYRAGIKLLYNYHRNGLTTVRGIIGRFAPVSENDTLSYIDFVSSKLSCGKDREIVCLNDFLLLCKYICKYESQVNVMPDYLIKVIDKHLPYVKNYFTASKSDECR